MESVFDIFKRGSSKKTTADQQLKTAEDNHEQPRRRAQDAFIGKTEHCALTESQLKNLQLITDECITLGNTVAVNCYNAEGELLLKKGWIIRSEDQFQRILKRGLYMEKGEKKQESAVLIEPPPVEKKAAKAVTPEQPFEFIEEIRSCLLELFTPVIDGIIAKNNRTPNGFSETTYHIAETIQTLCLTAPDAAIGSMHLTPVSHYMVSHPLNRAILCELVASQQKISIDARQTIIAAALTCDLSIFELQGELYHQRAPLSHEQKKTIDSHPQETFNLLKSLGVANRDWLTAVLQHHEQPNSKNNARKLADKNICKAAKLIMLADTYAAMVTPRSYRKQITPKEAMRRMYGKSGNDLDEEFTHAFIREMGVYPAGSFVRLENGETAVVIKRSNHLSSPIVRSILYPNGAIIPTPLRRNTANAGFKIKAVMPINAKLKVDFSRLWEL